MRRSLMAGLLAALLLSAGCATSPRDGAGASPDPAHNARNSLDWAGAYRGVLPCADCEGIETTVLLRPDGGYLARSRYLGESGVVSTSEGRFTWNAAGDAVSLAGDSPALYRVEENKLVRLALDGSPNTGPLAEHYVLMKLPDGPTETYWKLVELNGQPVPTLDREPYLILKDADGRVNGFGGCNGFSGGYTLDPATLRISFGQVVSTQMACAQGMEVEQAFHEVLRKADNYSLAGDHLTLNRARMAPLARFEAVYLR